MNKRKWIFGCAAVLIALPILVTTLFVGWQFARPQPAPKTETWFNGVEYTRDVRTSPRELVIHTIIVDLQAEGIRLLITPGDSDAELPLNGLTTSDFLKNFDLQIAINGSPFEPWSTLSKLSYYPHKGDPVDVIGYAASEGTVYAEPHPDAPTLYISSNNKARFNRPFKNIFNAISGTEMLVRNGKIVSSDNGVPQPRTAVGLSESEKQLIIIVVDGRQPGYSEGVTLKELAELMLFYGAYDAMNLDGGGSSALVREGLLGSADVINNPIDRGIPGWERVVGNHLGIFAKETQ
jgi:hypothetical protein